MKWTEQRTPHDFAAHDFAISGKGKIMVGKIMRERSTGPFRENFCTMILP
jgi:hypothetical protein